MLLVLTSDSDGRLFYFVGGIQEWAGPIGAVEARSLANGRRGNDHFRVRDERKSDDAQMSGLL